MNPNYIHTITVYHKEETDKKDTWSKRIIPDCFFKAVTGTVSSGNTLSTQNVYVARIPKQVPPLVLSPSDIIIKGEAQESITGVPPYTATEILKKYQPDAFRVTSFSDNTGFPVDKHYRAGG